MPTSFVKSFITSLPALMSLGADGEYTACTQPAPIPSGNFLNTFKSAH